MTTTHDKIEQDIPDSDLGSRDNAKDLLSFGKSFGLFDHTADGGVSFRVYGTESMWSTPLDINKDLVTTEDFVHTTSHVCSGSIWHKGEAKPEADSLVHARLYDMFPQLSGILRFKGGYVIPDATLETPDETGFGVLDAMDYKMDKSTLVELIDHGYLVLLIQGASELWISMTDTIDAAKQLVDLKDTELSPVFIGAKIAGLVIKSGEEYQLFLNVEYENSFEETLILKKLPEGAATIRG
jgi:hypothetical protein